ncbi:JmjC domain-containing protein [Burkholderia cenocepacia]|uniref:JmjC domain-containing protein n=1 Tax=Burkholderia cenocepacia TaxID=95486 RepID=UPI002AB21BAA|nr:cupin domain-containing protein [Burkholderia cenocepacia]
MRASPATLSRYIDNDEIELIRTSRSSPREARLLSADFHALMPSYEIIEHDLLSLLYKSWPDQQIVRAYGQGERLAALIATSEKDRSLVQLARAAECTLYFANLQTKLSYLGELAAAVGNSLDANITIGAFASPEDSAYTPIHYDYHDVLTYQIHGNKHWRCFKYAGDVSTGLNGYKIDHTRLGTAYLNDAVSQGQCVFIPKGVPHQANTGSAASLHLSIGIRPYRDEEIGTVLFSSIWRQTLHDDSCSALSIAQKIEFVAKELARQSGMIDIQALQDNAKIAKCSQYRRSKIEYRESSDKDFQLAPGCLYFIKETEDQIAILFPMEFRQNLIIDLHSFIPGKLEFPKAASLLFDILQHNPHHFEFSKIAAIYGEKTTHALLSILIEHSIIAPIRY